MVNGEVYNAADAREFLLGFPGWVRRQGQHLVSRGAVRSMICQEKDRFFIAEVRDGNHLYTTSLIYDEADGGGWNAECTCATKFECPHAYAALTALLDGNLPVADASDAASPAFPLQQRLTDALQRELTDEERQYVGRIHALYERSLVQGGLTGWDLQTLGVTSYYSWQHPRLWPAPPKDELEFWNYLVYAFHKYQAPIPEFMRPITDFTEIARSMAKLDRRERITQWQHRIQSASTAPAAEDNQRLDFRLVLAPKEFYLEWKAAEADPFQRLKPAQARRLHYQITGDQIEVAPEAYAIWDALFPPWGYQPDVEFDYEGEETRPMLNRLLRLPSLRERIVTPAGAPFARPAEPLRWQLTPANDANEDYVLRLIQPDGSAPPPIFLTLPGHPTLYVSTDTIFNGPPPCEGLDATAPNAIPSPAIETPKGLEFLLRLGLELPPRLAARTERVKLAPKITCQLKPDYYGSQGAEAVFLKVTAETDHHGVQETFSPEGWHARRTAGPKRKQSRDKLVLFDRSALRAFPGVLENLGAKWDAYTRSWRIRAGKQLPEKFIPWLQALPRDVEVKLEGELASLTRDPVAASIRLESQEAGVDWFDLKVALDVADTELTREELQALLDARGRYVRLGKKGWRRLQLNVSNEDDEQLARLGLNARDFSSEPQRLHVLQLADEAAARFLPAAQVRQIQRRVGELKTRVNPPVPEGMRAELRPYQVEGFYFLAYLSTNRFGGILADDMGLGKTLQALTWLLWLRAQPKAASKPALVVCPKSVMDTWHAEAARFAPELRVKLWRGAKGEAIPAALAETDVLVLNYTQLRAMADALARIDWLAAILDEGQYIKNPESQTARAARALKAGHRLTLSGTPIENRLLDLWSLMAFAMPGVLGNRTQFTKRFDQTEDPLARRRLVARVRPFLLRRTKAQVATELPDRVEEDLYCDLEGQQKTLYRAEFKRTRQMLLNIKTRAELNEFRFHFLTSLLRLRQICCHPALYHPEAKHAESAKLNALLDVLEPLMAGGHKVLVFSQFVTMLEILRQTVKAKGWPHFYLAGATEKRGELIEKFQTAPGAAVFLISLKAGGFGLNLTAASYVVLFDPWWNPAVENQAIDRTHRIGQTSKVMAYRLLAKDTIEEKIRALQRQKSALAQGILGEDSFAQSLTLEDLQFLFAEEPK